MRAYFIKDAWVGSVTMIWTVLAQIPMLNPFCAYVCNIASSAMTHEGVFNSMQNNRNSHKSVQLTCQWSKRHMSANHLASPKINIMKWIIVMSSIIVNNPQKSCGFRHHWIQKFKENFTKILGNLTSQNKTDQGSRNFHKLALKYRISCLPRSGFIFCQAALPTITSRHEQK